VTVDVWLHSEFGSDVLIETVQLDFSYTDSHLVLDDTFTFDFTSIPSDIGGYISLTCYDGHEELTCFDLPVPRAVHPLSCICPNSFMPLLTGGSLHVGHVDVRLPSRPGTYVLDVINTEGADSNPGARIVTEPYPPQFPKAEWRANRGEIAGGTYVLDVGPLVPTASEWGLITMAIALLISASIVITRRRIRRQRLPRRGEDRGDQQTRRRDGDDLRPQGVPATDGGRR